MNKQEIKLLIGLEVHITLKSKKKVFNWVNTYNEDVPPNSQVSPWELGYLGTLPVLNPECIELALKLALACKMKVSSTLIFDRKIYHYFDLSKGYQITQYRKPLASLGNMPLAIENKIKYVPLQNLQIEEDTAKAFHSNEGIKLDFNRAGNPLIELTTEPIFNDSKEVIIFLKQLQSLLRYLDVSEAKMEKGQLRVDLNFSLSLANDYQTPRYEVKNLNSFSNIEKVLQYELNKHKQLYQAKLPCPSSQTLSFDERRQITISQRKKTSYFYLPESNIPLIVIPKKFIIETSKNVPVLPWKKWDWLINEGIDKSYANLIIEKPFLFKVLVFLENKIKLNAKEYINWTTFFLNYLSPYLSNDNFPLFKKKWKSYLKLYELWQAKEMETGEIKSIAEQIITTNKNFAYLVKKYKKKELTDDSFIFENIKKLWNDSLTKKYLKEPQKVKNFLLGQIKRQFNNLDVKAINKVIDRFIDIRQKQNLV